MANYRKKPFAITQQQFENVLKRMETEPGNLMDHCKNEGVGHSSFYEIMRSSEANREKYARSKILQCEPMFESLITIADEPVPMTQTGGFDGAAVNDKRLRIDTRKWALSKVLPKKYGDRTEIEHSGLPVPPSEITYRVVQ